MADPRVAPLFVGPKNAELVCGAPWRWVRDTAKALGVRFVGSSHRQLIPAAELLEALSRSPAELDDAANDTAPADPAATVRALLERRRGGPR